MCTILNWRKQSFVKKSFNTSIPAQTILRDFVSHLSSKVNGGSGISYTGAAHDTYVRLCSESTTEWKNLVLNGDELACSVVSRIVERRRWLKFNSVSSVDPQSIIFFLHWEPEASTCPEGFEFFDQLLFK